MPDTHAVQGFRGQFFQLIQTRLQLLLFGNFGFKLLLNNQRRIDIDIAIIAVYRNKIAGFNIIKQAFYFGNNRDIQRLGNDGNVHCRRAVFNNQTADFMIVIIHQIRRPHGLSHHDNVIAFDNFASRTIIAAQIILQAVGDITQIMQALFEVLVVRRGQTIPHIFISTLDSGFGCQPGINIIGNFFIPAFILGKHPVSIQNVNVFANAEFG